MTHDELINKITISGDTSIEFALRAVVELHKPMQEITLHCQGCEWSYPCETIQAIEKELG